MLVCFYAPQCSCRRFLRIHQLVWWRQNNTPRETPVSILAVQMKHCVSQASKREPNIPSFAASSRSNNRQMVSWRHPFTLPVGSANKSRLRRRFSDKAESDDGGKKNMSKGLGGPPYTQSSHDATHSEWRGRLQRDEWTYIRSSSRDVYSTTWTQWYADWEHQLAQRQVWRLSYEMSFR